MKKFLSLTLVLIIVLTSCSKQNIQDVVIDNQSAKNTPDNITANTTVSNVTAPTFTTYLIRKGNHNCDQSSLKSVSTSEMKFIARFDTSAIYTSVNPVNQYDINKLYGFSEGFNNQYNSARIGWRWSDGALRLFGYVYKTGTRYSQEITSIPFNTDITCSIKLSGNTYLITANGISVSLPRGLNSTKASGFQQYPYFGGDEVAQKNITIKIRNL
jgi:hypothetical protein